MNKLLFCEVHDRNYGYENKFSPSEDKQVDELRTEFCISVVNL